MKVIDLKKSDILLFYQELTEEGYSAGTIKILHKIIHPALDLACDDNIIGKNPITPKDETILSNVCNHVENRITNQ